MSTKQLVLTSNMLNERPQLEGWLETVKPIADGGILVVDGGSTDGTKEFLEENNVKVIVDNIIQREGYGPARNHLREMTRKYFPEAHWTMYLDADERIDPAEHHTLRFIKDYLINNYDVIAFPRIDWMDEERSSAAKDWHVYPDYQARMTRVYTGIKYIRKLHEQITNFRGIYSDLMCPKINHFHRSAGQEKRDMVGKLCAKLHSEDKKYGGTYPKHHKEDYYYKQYKKNGL